MEFKLPDIGEGIQEGEIVKWLVSEGDHVEEDHPLVEIMTDKATVELPSPVPGIIKQILLKNGDTATVGQTIVIIQEKGEPAKPVKAGDPFAETTKGEIKPAKPPFTTPGKTLETVHAGSRAIATPAVRRYARDKNIDINLIKGSGPRGRVTRDDINNYLETTTPKVQPVKHEKDNVPAGKLVGKNLEKRIQLQGIRKRISDHMIESKHKAAHFTHVEEADCTRLVNLRNTIIQSDVFKHVKLTYLPFIMKTLVPALKLFPQLNSSLDLENNEIVLKQYYNFGFAVDTPSGLVVPVIKNVEQKSIRQIAEEIIQLSKLAFEERLKLDNIQGSTFTITNIGSIGGIISTPILNYPEVAILAIGKIKKRPVVVSGEIVIREMVYLSLSLDHRVVDGAMGARFLNHLIRFVEKPELLFFDM